ncbi:MAG TPA: adenosylcobalamin-dependent ribonucleoside-diphosphate reductase [Planctomycetota bacterium]|nr:adenosylcobalamin-dependent ribonucleoside-diphosphate reductase [Planctomycetota bacterium]
MTERQLDGGDVRSFGRPDVPVSLVPNAVAILRKRYLLKDEHGRPAESPEELLWRVALHVALAERVHGADDARVRETSSRFYRMMAALDFLPNSPTLMNAGRRLGQYFACFVLPVADSIIDEKDEGIFDTLRSAAFIHKTGGGTGFDFSRIRPEATRVESTHGRASGPISFMRVFNAATDAIHQGGFRRGANMGILRVDHPDILDFIRAKSDPRELRNFNLSIAVTDEFLRSLRGNLKHFVVDPHTGRKTPLRDKVRDAEGNVSGVDDREWTARDVFDLAVQRAWESGEPGLFFVDRANRHNPTPAAGEISATNPCGEQALLPWEACNLGSINLAHFVEPAGTLGTATSPESRIRWKALAETAALAVRFLDDVIDVNSYPKPQIEEVVKANRKIGLGVMGWADMLFRLGVPYESEQALSLGRLVMRFVRDEGWKASQDLARERGPFPRWAGSAWTQNHAYFAAGAPMRNAMVTTVAPTGTISILAGCSAGIEPLYSLAFVRQILNGEKLPEVHPYFQEIAEREKFASPALTGRLAREGSCRGISEIPARWRDIFACAHDVSPEGHLRMQSAFQEFTDNAVSKTVNFRAEATPEDVRRVFELAIEHGVKGVTVYRDRSRKTQPMALRNPGPPAAPSPAGPLPDVVGRLVSVGLSHGATAEEIARAMAPSTAASEACPECGRPLRREEGCTKCACGYSRC